MRILTPEIVNEPSEVLKCFDLKDSKQGIKLAKWLEQKCLASLDEESGTYGGDNYKSIYIRNGEYFFEMGSVNYWIRISPENHEEVLPPKFNDEFELEE